MDLKTIIRTYLNTFYIGGLLFGAVTANVALLVFVIHAKNLNWMALPWIYGFCALVTGIMYLLERPSK